MKREVEIADFNPDGSYDLRKAVVDVVGNYVPSSPLTPEIHEEVQSETVQTAEIYETPRQLRFSQIATYDLSPQNPDPKETFDRMTVSARAVLELAKEESRRFNHNYIGTEHLLLGIMNESDGTGSFVLDEFSVRVDMVRSAVEFVVGKGDQPVPEDTEISFTPRAKKVMEYSADESRRMGDDHIGTHHLLLGLVREGEGVAAVILESLGVNLDRARAQTEWTLS